MEIWRRIKARGGSWYQESEDILMPWPNELGPILDFEKGLRVYLVKKKK